METLPTALTRCLDDVLERLVSTRPLPAQTVLRQGLRAARVTRGLVQLSPSTSDQAEARITTLMGRLERTGLPWEPLAWAVYAFGSGRDDDVAWVLLDGQDPASTAPLRALFPAGRRGA